MTNAALHLWGLGLGLVSCDYFLSFDVFNFTIKSYYFLFLLSFMLCLGEIFKYKSFAILDLAFKKFTFRSPFLFAVLLIIYEFLIAPFSLIPRKSFAYATWLTFDVFVVSFSLFIISQLLPQKRILAVIYRYVLGSAGLLALITIIDFVAFFYGYKAGLIGYNQDRDLNWGMSRPHAFAYEPSYLGMFLGICFIHIFAQGIALKKAMLHWLVLSLIFLAMAAMFSRSTWISLFLSLCVLCLYLGKKLSRGFYAKAGVLLFLLCTTIFLLAPQQQLAKLHERLINTVLHLRDGSGVSRINSMRFGVDVGNHTNGIGTGPGASLAYFIQNIDTDERFFFGGQLVMNIWFEIYAETGFAGILCFTLFVFSMLRALWTLRKGDEYSLGAFANVAVYFLVTCHFVGNIARTDFWVWSIFWFVHLSAGKTMEQSEKNFSL